MPPGECRVSRLTWDIHASRSRLDVVTADAVPRRREQGRHLVAQGATQRLDALGSAEEQRRQVVQPGQLARGVGVVVDAQVGEHAAAVVAGARREGEDRRALPAPRVTAGGVPGQTGPR